MLLNALVTKYAWLITNVPQILYSRYRWKSWLDDLSAYDILNLRMNISGIRHYKHLIEDEFDNHDPEPEVLTVFVKFTIAWLNFRCVSRPELKDFLP